MFKKILLISLVSLLVFGSVAFAGQTVYRGVKATAKTIPGPTDTIAFEAKNTSGTTVYRWDYAGEERQVNLPILGWTDESALLVTTDDWSITPFLASVGTACYIKWKAAKLGSGSATDIARISFRVPDDYSTAPTIRFDVSHDEATTNWGANSDGGSQGSPVQISWRYAQTDGSGATEVRTSALIADGTITDDTWSQTVTVSLNSSDISAGDVISLSVWPKREGVEYGTPALRMYNAAFRYKALY